MQCQLSNTSAEWTPVALLDLQRCGPPVMTRKTAPLQFCRIVLIALRKTASATRFSHPLHLFERQSSYTCTIRAPAPLSNTRGSRPPLVADRALPSQRGCGVGIER